ncbi:MAG: SRPBCC family protein [Aureispira sp.]
MAFKKHLYTQIHLPATPLQVWQILTNTAAYPEWNPFIKELTGKMAQGEQLSAQIQNMRFRPIIIQYQPQRELRWLGKLLVKGLFDGEHVFRLEEQQDGSTILHHEEYFSGLLVPLFARQLEQQTKASFVSMNQAIEQRLIHLKRSI